MQLGEGLAMQEKEHLCMRLKRAHCEVAGEGMTVWVTRESSTQERTRWCKKGGLRWAGCAYVTCGDLYPPPCIP